QNLRRDSFGDVANNLFGLDEGANIALEFRYGVVRHLQAVFQRTSVGRTIQFSAQYDAWHQHGSTPVSVSGLVSVEGDNNFPDSYAPAVGAVVSRTISKRLAIYATPVVVGNTGTGSAQRRNTAFIGTGVRARILSSTYLAAEVSPRIGGLSLGDPAFGVALEK